jgi:hypothetical protein
MKAKGAFQRDGKKMQGICPVEFAQSLKYAECCNFPIHITALLHHVNIFVDLLCEF